MNRLIRSFLSIVFGLVLVGGASAARAQDASPLERDLSRYFPIREALAKDDLPRAKDQAKELAKSEDTTLARAAEALAKAGELEAARRTFGEISKGLVERVKAAKKKGEPTGKIFIFRCPMAKPEGSWLQEKREIGNPYFGAAMAKCGKLVETIGDS